jgi:hypothetical protein
MAQGNSDPEGPLGDGITRSVATVALGADDLLAWSILTNSPDTPLYQEVLSLLYPLCGGCYHLAGAESTSLATRDEVSMSYTVASGRVTLDNAVGFGWFIRIPVCVGGVGPLRPCQPELGLVDEQQA